MIKDIEATWLMFKLAADPATAECILHDSHPQLPPASRSVMDATLKKIGLSIHDYCELAEYAQRQKRRGRK